MGFEPTEVFTLQQFSRLTLSSTQPTTQNRGTALDRMCRTTCSPWDSNPHYTDFKSAASANWARRASPPHMRGVSVPAWNRTKDLLIFNQTLYQLSYKNLPTTNRSVFSYGGHCPSFLTKPVTWVTNYEVNIFILFMSIQVRDGRHLLVDS